MKARIITKQGKCYIHDIDRSCRVIVEQFSGASLRPLRYFYFHGRGEDGLPEFVETKAVRFHSDIGGPWDKNLEPR